MVTTLHGAPGTYPRGYVEVAPHTWAWLEPNGSWGEANAGLVRGGGETLVVDTLWDAALAAEMLTGAVHFFFFDTVTTEFYTHRDGDHWWGNVALPPDVEIWTSAEALAEIEEEPPPRALATLARLSGLGTRVPGRLGRLSRYTADMLGPFGHGSTVPRRPAASYRGEHTLDVGGRVARLITLGPAHTAGDLVVHVPDAGVVYTGDLLFVAVTPVIWNGPVSSWVAALDALLALDVETYGPGPGPRATRADVQALRDYWTWLVEATRREFDAGREPPEVMRNLVEDDDFGRFRGWSQAERLALIVLARHRELHGAGPAGHDPLSRSRMFSEVAELHRYLGRGGGR